MDSSSYIDPTDLQESPLFDPQFQWPGTYLVPDLVDPGPPGPSTSDIAPLHHRQRDRLLPSGSQRFDLFHLPSPSQAPAPDKEYQFHHSGTDRQGNFVPAMSKGGRRKGSQVPKRNQEGSSSVRVDGGSNEDMDLNDITTAWTRDADPEIFESILKWYRECSTILLLQCGSPQLTQEALAQVSESHVRGNPLAALSLNLGVCSI